MRQRSSLYVGHLDEFALAQSVLGFLGDGQLTEQSGTRIAREGIATDAAAETFFLGKWRERQGVESGFGFQGIDP